MLVLMHFVQCFCLMLLYMYFWTLRRITLRRITLPYLDDLTSYSEIFSQCTK